MNINFESFDSFLSSFSNLSIKDSSLGFSYFSIVFVDGPAGRRARIEGTGIDVWELISAYQELNNNLSALNEAFHWLTDRQIMAAIGYAKTYPEEIKRLIKMNKAWSKEKARAELPFARKKG